MWGFIKDHGLLSGIVGAVLAAVIVVSAKDGGGGQTGSGTPSTGGTAPTTTQSTPSPPIHAPPRRLIDLIPVGDTSASYETGPADVGGKTVPDAFLIMADDGPTELDLALGGKYGTLRATIGKTTGQPDVTGGPMEIQLLLDTRSAPVLDETVAPDSPPVRRTILLHKAETLRIVVTSGGVSIYDQAVIAGVVKS